MAWTLAAPLVRQPHDHGLDRVLHVLLRDPLPGADQRVTRPGPHIRQVDRIDPVCHPARAPHVLPFHSGLADLFLPGHAGLADCTPSPSAPSTLPGVQTRQGVVSPGVTPQQPITHCDNRRLPGSLVLAPWRQMRAIAVFVPYAPPGAIGNRRLRTPECRGG